MCYAVLIGQEWSGPARHTSHIRRDDQDGCRVSVTCAGRIGLCDDKAHASAANVSSCAAVCKLASFATAAVRSLTSAGLRIRDTTFRSELLSGCRTSGGVAKAGCSCRRLLRSTSVAVALGLPDAPAGISHKSAQPVCRISSLVAQSVVSWQTLSSRCMCCF